MAVPGARLQQDSCLVGLIEEKFLLSLTCNAELGGCAIANEGHNLTYNKHAWNNVANMIYLDRERRLPFVRPILISL